MRFFTADTHFEHEGIITMMARVNPQAALIGSIEEHDALLIDNINKTVGRDDELIIVGDFAWRKPGKFRQLISCRNVKLVLGNHDPVTKCQNVFGDVQKIMWTKCRNEKQTDSLYLHVQHHPAFYWEGSHRGWGHIYGHTHGQREEYLDTIEPQRRGLDVGVDNAYRLFGEYRPFSEVEVFDYMARRSGHDDLRFYEDYQQGLYVDRGLYKDV